MTDKYKLLLLDPPWAFKVHSEKGTAKSAENHYPCLDIKEQIKLAPYIKEIMDKDSACIMWTTTCFLKIAIDLMETYGFKYKTCGAWVKLTKDGINLATGTGYHLRNSHEIFLIGTRGTGACPKQGTQKLSVILEPEEMLVPRMEHSRKPEEQYAYAELYGGPYIELYARRPREGWTSLGNQLEGMDLRDSLPLLIEWLNTDTPHKTTKRNLKVKTEKYAKIN